MITQQLPEDVIQTLMMPGVFDVLNIIPIEDIEQFGITFVRTLINETGSKAEWKHFGDISNPLG